MTIKTLAGKDNSSSNEVYNISFNNGKAIFFVLTKQDDVLVAFINDKRKRFNTAESSITYNAKIIIYDKEKQQESLKRVIETLFTCDTIEDVSSNTSWVEPNNENL